jgi:hypothetical protein
LIKKKIGLKIDPLKVIIRVRVIRVESMDTMLGIAEIKKIKTSIVKILINQLLELL